MEQHVLLFATPAVWSWQGTGGPHLAILLAIELYRRYFRPITIQVLQ